jgi:plastocyanin
MSIIKPLALLTAALPLIAACGGGEKEAAAPPPGNAAPAAGAPAAAGGAAKGSASITGKITYDGAVPAPEKVKLSADPKCQGMHPQGLEKQPVRVSNGGLADVFVWVKSGISGTYPAPSDAVLLDQKGCNYSPHIITAQAGQTIKIRNSDDTLHNIHPRPTVNQEFNIGQPRQGMESSHTFDKQEIMIPVGCDVHPWMRSYISVVGHPFFAVTKEDGSYEIKGLPAGDYEIEAVHEKLKSTTGKVSVKDGEAAKLDLAYKG